MRPPVVPAPAKYDRRVPNRLQHLFWNTASEQLDVDAAGPYIARRLISTGDLDGLAWGSRNLTAADWQAASQARGLDPASRAMALNLAQAAPR